MLMISFCLIKNTSELFGLFIGPRTLKKVNKKADVTFYWEFYFDNGRKHLIEVGSQLFYPLSPSYNPIEAPLLKWNVTLVCSHRHTHIPWRRKRTLEEVTANIICKNQFRDRVCCRQQADRPPGSALDASPWRQLRAREGTVRCRRRISTSEVSATCIYFCALAVSLNTKHMRFVSSIFILSAIGKLCAPREWESNFNYTTRRRCCVCVWFC